MYRSFILLFVLLAFAIEAQSQFKYDYDYTQLDTAEVLATYSLAFMPDTNDLNFSGKTEMYLFLGKKISMFQSKGGYMWDTIFKSIHNFDQMQAYMLNPDKPNPGFRYKVFKNYPSGKITFIEHVPSNTFLYEEELSIFNWQLHPDTSTIGGHLCQKATMSYSGRNWTAWFCQQIPYSDGPYKFCGLPGLIVNIQDDRQHYVFELKSIEKASPYHKIELKDKEYLVTTKEKFFKAKDGFYNDILSRAKAAEFPTETQAAILKNVSRKNNPLELIRE